MNQGPRCVRLMEKSGGRKSRATVPLSMWIKLAYGVSMVKGHILTGAISDRMRKYFRVCLYHWPMRFFVCDGHGLEYCAATNFYGDFELPDLSVSCKTKTIGEPGSSICSRGPKSGSMPGTKESEPGSIYYRSAGSRPSVHRNWKKDLCFVHRNRNGSILRSQELELGFSTLVDRSRSVYKPN